jgi:hypothetical protein
VASKQEYLAMLMTHGARRLAHVDIDAYNAEINDKEGFVGDRASGRVGACTATIVEMVRRYSAAFI